MHLLPSCSSDRVPSVHLLLRVASGSVDAVVQAVACIYVDM
jgi:hypothetical protein